MIKVIAHARAWAISRIFKSDLCFSVLPQRTQNWKYLFQNPATGKPLRWIVKHGFPSACSEANIPYGIDTPNGITFHSLRHTWATRACECDVNPYTIRGLMGHSTVNMTSDYTHSTPSTRRQAIEILGKNRNEFGKIVAIADFRRSANWRKSRFS